MTDIRTLDFYQDVFREFPGLERALEPKQVLQSVLGNCPQILPATGNWQVETGKVYVKAKKHVRVIYHFTQNKPDGEPGGFWAWGRIYNRNTAAKKKTESEGKVYRLLDGQMSFHLYTGDKKLPEIPHLTNSHWLEDYWKAHQSQFPAPFSAEISQNHIFAMKYVPGKRMLFKYRIKSSEGTAGSYLKYFQGQQGRYSARIQTYLNRQLGPAPEIFCVPRVFCYDDDHHFFWQEDWGGSSLKEMHPEADQKENWRQILTAVAALHKIPPPAWVTNHINPAHFMNDFKRDLTHIDPFLPGDESALKTLYRNVAGQMENLSAQTAFLHGSLFLAQVLQKEGQIAFIDFDGAALGDPWYDVSEFLASLLYTRWMEGAVPEKLFPYWDAAIGIYGELAGMAVPRQRLAAYFLIFFLNKIQQHVKMLKPVSAHFLSELEQILNHYQAQLKGTSPN